jgi:hypothetical protein
VALATVILGLFAYSASIQKRATQIVADLAATSAADDPNASFESLKRKYGSNLKRSEWCSSKYCEYEVSINNRLLTALHVAPYAEMSTVFFIDNGSFSGAITNYTVTRRDGVGLFVHVQEDYCRQNCPASDWLAVNPHGRRSTDFSNGMVEFSTKAAGEGRQAARSFNFRCFRPLSRCEDIVDLLPAIWERNPDGSMRCRFRTSGDAYNDWEPAK